MSAGPAAAQSTFLTEEELYSEEMAQDVQVSDPLEFINRPIFHFNDFVFDNVVRPVSNVYTAVTPDTLETGAKNFFRNLRYPVRLAGNVLQGRFDGAWRETKRFAVNTTAGLGGVLSPADDMEGFERIPPEGVIQALGAWGIPEGPYLVLPLMGPSNVRDLFGMFGDAAANPTVEPFSLIDGWGWEARTTLQVSEFIVASPELLRRYDRMKGSAIDPYSSLKQGYTQFRRRQIAE
jgi:phospholipid-binding lipoprotein MlaA